MQSTNYTDDFDGSDDYTTASLQELIDELSSCGVPVPPGLAEAIVAHGSEAVPVLSLLVSQQALWQSDSDATAWAPVHAMHLLGMIGDPAAVEALLEPLRWREESDYMVEALPGVFARLGPKAIPMLHEFALDPAQEDTLRAVAYDGLAGMALLDPSLVEEVKQIGREVVSRCLAGDEDFPTFIGFTLAMFQDSDDRALLRTLYDSGNWEGFAASWRDIEEALRDGFDEPEREHVLRDPARYFSPQEQERLAKIQGETWRAAPREEEERPAAQEEAEGKRHAPLWKEAKEEDLPWRPAPPAPAVKIGRNQPCPCGSGRKYKKCCGKPGRA